MDYTVVYGVAKSRTQLSKFHYVWKGLFRQFSGKESICQCWRRRRHRLDPLVRKLPWKRKQQPTPVFSPGESHGERGLAGYSPWDHKESDMTEAQSMYRNMQEFGLSKIIPFICISAIGTGILCFSHPMLPFSGFTVGWGGLPSDGCWIAGIPLFPEDLGAHN